MLHFNYYALEIQEAEMPLICKPFARGHIVPEMLVVLVYGRQQTICFHSAKQVYLTRLHQACLITCGREVRRLEDVRTYACP